MRKGASICDLGGGTGHMLIKIGKAHPHLQLKLQDIPERVEQAKEIAWPREFPEAMEEKRIEFKPVNFFTESPIAGCDVYYVSSTDILLQPVLNFYTIAEAYPVCRAFTCILYSANTSSSHDWQDSQCLEILRNLRKAMGPHSRVLIRTRPLLESK